MRKNVLALSIAAMIGGFAGMAQAGVIDAVAVGTAGAALGTNVATALATPGGVAPVADSLVVNPNNIGHMLVVPYYTAQNGNMTVLHLTNTDRANGKAVKIRFRGAANSDDVKDFQIFLSPGDVWTGAVAQSAGGAAVLYSGDGTCTVPAIPAGGSVFETLRLNNATNVNGTREGYVEIFNMADIPSTRTYRADPLNAALPVTSQSALYTVIKHNGGVAPCAASPAARAVLDQIATQNYTAAAAAGAVGFGFPTTGLSADWYILNLAQSTAFSGAATAIEARLGGAAGAGKFVHFPQTGDGSAAFFNVAVTSADKFTADPLLRQMTSDKTGVATTTGPVVTPLFVDLPDMSTPYVNIALPVGASADNAPKQQAVALTSALARTSVANQYALDAGINAATDWVFSMPTRRYSVAANYAAPSTAPGYMLFSDLSSVNDTATTLLAGSPATGTADEWFHRLTTRVDSRGNLCIDAAGLTFFDREEQTTVAAPVFSPAVAGLTFCGETSVLSFSASKVLGSSSDLAAITLTNTPFANGWAMINTPNAFTAAGNTAGATAGLPILGNAFIKVNNNSAGAGFASTFGITWSHRYNQ